MRPSSKVRRATAAALALAIVMGLTLSASMPVGSRGPSARMPSRSAEAMGLADMNSDVRYAAIFRGDATGRTDVTSALRTFLERHDGQRVAFARDGIYKVTQMSFTAHHLTIDFRGARIRGSRKGAHGIFRIQTSVDVTVNDAKVYGTGYGWNPVYQFEHAIQIDGGQNITLNDPFTRNTRGDGIYVGFQVGKNDPPTGVVINRPNVERASRDGISPVAGQVTIIGGRVIRVGLHGINFEPTTMRGGASIRGIVDGVVVREHGQLKTGHSTYAVAAAGFIRGIPIQPTKKSILVKNVSGDCLRMVVSDTATVTVRNNVSDTVTTAKFLRSGLVAFDGNVHIIGTLRPLEACYDPAFVAPNATSGAGDIPGMDWTLIAHNILYWMFVTAPTESLGVDDVRPELAAPDPGSLLTRPAKLGKRPAFAHARPGLAGSAARRGAPA